MNRCLYRCKCVNNCDSVVIAGSDRTLVGIHCLGILDLAVSAYLKLVSRGNYLILVAVIICYD